MVKKVTIFLAGAFALMLSSCKTTGSLDNKYYENSIAEIIDESKNPDRFVYKHTVIVGIDGAGAYEKKCKTPNMDSIFADGLWTPHCQASYPTISAPCWASMLIGVTPSVHKITNNRASSGLAYCYNAYPTIFKLARATDPDAKLAAFCNWYPIYSGIIEQTLDVVTGTGEDDQVAAKAADYIKAEKPELLFIQFDSVDHAGHSSGYGKKEYLKALETVDGYVGKIYEAVKEAGILEDTLFILTADHGGHFKCHGGASLEETQIYFGAAGKTVNQSKNLYLNGRDLAAIVCHAMNYKTNKLWDSTVPKKFFNEAEKTVKTDEITVTEVKSE